MLSLTQKTTRAALWAFADLVARRGVTILVTLTLAYFLTPEDFGLVAMLAVFVALGQNLMQSGFREALIRQEDVTQEEFCTAFYANLLLGLLAYGLLFACAPLIAVFYEEPRLIALVRVIGLNVVLHSFQTVQVASLSRRLNFKAQLQASLPAALVSGLAAIGLAYLGWGVWALAIQMLLNTCIHTMMLWHLEGWRPSLLFGWDTLKRMYRFGYKLFISGALNTVFKEIYVIVIAKVFSAATAGLFFFANKLKEIIAEQLVRAVRNATFPALASIQSDNVRLKAAYKRVVVLMALLYFPAITFIAALSEPVFHWLLPSRWHSSATYFQLLSLSVLLLPMHSLNLNILQVKGRSDLFLGIEVVKKINVAVMLWITYRFGIQAVIIGMIIVSVINYIPNGYYSKRLLDYSVGEQLGDFLPVLMVTLGIAALGWILTRSIMGPEPVKILLSGLAMVLTYGVWVRVFRPVYFQSGWKKLSFLQPR